jgi:hypothetical protein
MDDRGGTPESSAVRSRDPAPTSGAASASSPENRPVLATGSSLEEQTARFGRPSTTVPQVSPSRGR